MRYTPKQGRFRKYAAWLASLALFSGCFQSLSPEKNSGAQKKPVEKVLVGHKTEMLTERDAKYETQEIVINHKPYFFRGRTAEVNYNLKNKGIPCFLTITALQKEKTARIISGQKVSFEPETPDDDYAFVLQTTNEGEPVMKLSIRSGDSVSASASPERYSIRAVDETQMPYALDIVSINTPEGIKKFYAPQVPSSDEKDSNALPFLMIPKDNSVIRIGPEGRITIIGPLYRGISSPVAQEYSELLSKISEKQGYSRQTRQSSGVNTMKVTNLEVTIETDTGAVGKNKNGAAKAQRELDELITKGVVSGDGETGEELMQKFIKSNKSASETLLQ